MRSQAHFAGKVNPVVVHQEICSNSVESTQIAREYNLPSILPLIFKRLNHKVGECIETKYSFAFSRECFHLLIQAATEKTALVPHGILRLTATKSALPFFRKETLSSLL